MYGAFIGDIVGSKYEFNNIKTKEFPLFSPGCDYTDDTIMTVAVAKAILLSRQEQFKHTDTARGFREILVGVMQDFGRRYPHPAGAYGGRFADWLRQKDPKPYNSFGNGSAMRVSPCGLAAISLEEAEALARASADVTHSHPEGLRGAMAVAAAVFLAKSGKSKEDIRKYISDNYYCLEFTLDSIRDTYSFDETCQGSVPQAIVAFLESRSFEDALRNVISIGGDCDTTGAITGAIAWTYYAVQSGTYCGWVCGDIDPAMLGIRKQAETYLPKEFAEIAEQFHEICWRRAGTYERTGFCTPILNPEECAIYFPGPYGTLTPELESTVTAFFRKYMVLIELLHRDKELNQWCRTYSAYQECTTHQELKNLIYDGFMADSYQIGFMTGKFAWKSTFYPSYSLKNALAGGKLALLGGINTLIRSDYHSNGSLIYHSIAKGELCSLMKEWLRRAAFPLEE